MIDFHRILDFKPRYTRQHLSEIVEMLEIIHEDRPIRNTVEIGTFEGGTAYLWGQLARENHGNVYCIDDIMGPYPATATEWERREMVYRGTPIEPYIVEIVGNSRDPAVQARLANLIMVAGVQYDIDLLFIDGDHSYDVSRADFEDYRWFVRKDGWVALHDIKKPGMGVARLWEEIARNYEHHEIIMQRQHPDAQVSIYETTDIIGIGLIRWRG